MPTFKEKPAPVDVERQLREKGIASDELGFARQDHEAELAAIRTEHAGIINPLRQEFVEAEDEFAVNSFRDRREWSREEYLSRFMEHKSRTKPITDRFFKARGDYRVAKHNLDRALNAKGQEFAESTKDLQMRAAAPISDTRYTRKADKPAKAKRAERRRQAEAKEMVEHYADGVEAPVVTGLGDIVREMGPLRPSESPET